MQGDRAPSSQQPSSTKAPNDPPNLSDNSAVENKQASANEIKPEDRQIESWQPQQESKPQQKTDKQGGAMEGEEQQPAVKEEDKRSVFVENVDYATTKQQLETIFGDCGKVIRVTILRDKFTGNPRGLAYVEFQNVDSVEKAIVLTGLEHRGRVIRVSPKRTNIKGLAKPKKKPNFAQNPTALLQGLMGFLNPKGRKPKIAPPKPKA